MIYALLIFMTLLIVAYVVAWFVVPSLRQTLEGPNQHLLDNSEKFNEHHFNTGRD
jgi:type II secretory pathway component PulF